MVGVEIAIMGVCMLANANSQTQGIVAASPDGSFRMGGARRGRTTHVSR